MKENVIVLYLVKEKVMAMEMGNVRKLQSLLFRVEV